MKKSIVPLFIALSAAAFIFAANVSAQESKAKTPQQQKFSDCAHQSKGMKGDAHKEFMSKCLKGSGDAAAMKSEASKANSAAGKAEEKTSGAMAEQRERMKTCNTQAKEKSLKGKDRRSFMSQCLKS